MAYSFTNSKGKTYYLHCKTIVSKSGSTRELYYFAGDLRLNLLLMKFLSGKEVVELASGLPALKKE